MKKDKIFFWIITILTVGFVFCVTLSGIINHNISDLDELWQFNISKQIGNGLIPYTDISMITTPLTSWIGAIFLNIIGVNVFNFRILTAIIVSIIALVTMLICKELTNKKLFAFVTTMILTEMFLINYRLDYNVTTNILVLIILLIELKLMKKYNNETNSKVPLKFNHIIIGIVSGLAIINKQTLGIFISLAVIIVPLLFLTKDNKKNILKNILYRIIGIVIPVAIFIVYLLISNSFYDCMSYIILGIKSFDNFIGYSKLIEKREGGINVLAILVPMIEILTLIVILVVRIGKHKGKKSTLEKSEFDKLQLLFIYSLPMFTLIYPIADRIHFLIGIYVISILIMYELYISIQIIIKNKKEKTKYLIYIFSFILLMGYPVYSNLVYLKENTTQYIDAKKSDIHYYENTVYSSAIQQRVYEIENFINLEQNKGYKIIIVDAEAAASEIPLDIYNKNYSMFTKGNLGAKGEDGIIEDIKKSEKCIYLIKNSRYKPNWQNPSKVTNFIKENLYLIDSVYVFDCYVVEAGGR